MNNTLTNDNPKRTDGCSRWSPRLPATVAPALSSGGDRVVTVRVTTLKGGGIVNYLESQGVSLYYSADPVDPSRPVAG